MPDGYALSPAVKTVPGIRSINAAVAESPFELQEAMSPAPTRTGYALAASTTAKPSTSTREWPAVPDTRTVMRCRPTFFHA